MMPQDIINLEFIHISKKAIVLCHIFLNLYSQITMPPSFSESAADFMNYGVKMGLSEITRYGKSQKTQLSKITDAGAPIPE